MFHKARYIYVDFNRRLDPEKAREDLKPYSAAAGRMINNVIENIDIVKEKNIEANSLI